MAMRLRDQLKAFQGLYSVYWTVAFAHPPFVVWLKGLRDASPV